MKRNISITILLAIFMFMAMPTFSQVSNDNADEVNKIDQHAARINDFVAGEVLVKFRETAPVKVQKARGKYKAAGVTGVDKVLSAFGVEEMEHLMPNTSSLATVRRVKGVSNDVSKLYYLRIKSARPDSTMMLVEQLKQLGEVEYAEPNYKVYSLSDNGVAASGEYDDPLCTEQWGNGQLKLNFLWKQKKITDKRPVIAILDTGIDITHPDLVDNIWTNASENDGVEGEDDDNNGFKDDLHGWDFVNNTNRIGDWNGHGTHCAGIAAATGNNKIGITGANPDALIMPVTVMQSDGTGDVATIIKGIDYAVANGATVISMSFGGYAYSMAEEQALAKAYSSAVLVAAAGNDNKCIYAHDCEINKKNSYYNGPMFPAAFTFVLGVEAGTQNGNIASFSNFDHDGPVFSEYGEEKLYNYELRGPGASIMSTYPGGKYKKLNGTSMACPYVAGAISRLLQCKEYGNWEILFGDLIHARKKSDNGLVDFEAAYKITDADRKPSLGMVTYVLKDTIEGDGDGKPDAGETIAFYPTLRNEWGQAKNIRFTLELAETEDPTIVEILDTNVDFGKELSSYAKNISANPVRFKVRKDCADGRKICMVLRATCDNITEELVQELTLTAENGVEIGGMLTEDLTLYPNVHYIVTKNLAVTEDATLTILPGTVLKFKAGVSMYVPKGNLLCEGEPGNMIVFTMADHETGLMQGFYLDYNTVKYVHFKGLRIDGLEISPYLYYGLESMNMENCIIEDCLAGYLLNYGVTLKQTNLIFSTGGTQIWSTSPKFLHSNVIGNVVKGRHFDNFGSAEYKASNAFGNVEKVSGDYVNIGYYSGTPKNYVPEKPNYLGSAREDIIRKGLWDMNHPVYNVGFGSYNLSNTLTRPSTEAHGIVWKVVVNGYDAQDEFEQLPPLGVGKHKFEVYFNRPMNKEVTPTIAMGVRSPYTSHTIAEDGSWNEDGTIYTAYLTITGKTGADGLNRIYVSGAEDDEFFEIPIENMRFNVEVAAAGSMATGLMAEAGLGKVSLTWETDEEDFEDLLGYNIYRYTMENGISSDSLIINENVIDGDATSYIDYDVVPGTTYYYVIKQLTTSLNSHALSNAVAATPLTAQKGDANGSMKVDVADVVTEVGYITYQDPQPFIFEAADVNADNTVNVLDVVGTINIILHPEENGINNVNEEPVRYYIENGILYVEAEQPLGGMQIRMNVDKQAEITALEALDGMEQTITWTNDDECLFLAFSMSGRTLPAGKHALLKISDEANVTEAVFADNKGRNLMAVSGNATGISSVVGVQMNIPAPNPFSTYLDIPYVVTKEGNHNISIVFCDLAGRVIDSYHTTNTKGSYVYTWHPASLREGLYLTNLYLDGKLIQTSKVICDK